MTILPVALLLLTAVGMAILRWLRPRFAYFWLLGALGSVAAWISLWVLPFLTGPVLPQEPWLPASIYQQTLLLAADRVAWSYSMALTTLALAVMLTEVIRAPEADWASWGGSLALTALGLLASLAGNLFTLVLVWTVADLVELVILLGYVPDRRGSERVVVSFFARSLGSLVVISAAVVAGLGVESYWSAVLGQGHVLLILAAGLRLGVLPLHRPFLEEPPVRRGLGTIVRMVPVAASLVLLTRIARAEFATPWLPLLVPLVLLASLYGSLSWAGASNELDGRPYWILGMGSLALVSALHGSEYGSLAWGVGLLLAGGMLFLYSEKGRKLRLLLLLGLWTITAIPFSPTWLGAEMYAAPLQRLVYAFLIPQAAILVGYWRHASRPANLPGGGEPWVRAIYPSGLVLLPVVSAAISLWPWAPPGGDLRGPWWPGVLSLALALAAWGVSRRIRVSLPEPLGLALRLLSLDWLYRLLWGLYRLLGRLVELLNALQEGRGGVLWALLVLILLLTFLAQSDLGGLANGN